LWAAERDGEVWAPVRGPVPEAIALALGLDGVLGEGLECEGTVSKGEVGLDDEAEDVAKGDGETGAEDGIYVWHVRVLVISWAFQTQASISEKVGIL
jgi:hypothetical protein